MKRLLTAMIIVVSAAIQVVAQKQLTVLHTNDTHSCVMPLNPNLADTLVAGRGGYIRRLALLEEERAKHPDLLLFDTGDFSQGSPYYSIFKGEVEVQLMNRMRYDAVAIGNHEFDFGLENMARIFRMANFPVVCANYDFKGTPVEGLVKPYVVVERDGIRIGVFGIAPQLEGLVFAQNCEGVKYLDPIATAKGIVRKLRKEEKCDVVICLSHLGWDIEGVDDTELAAQTRDIDLILGGHTHTYMPSLEYTENLDGMPVPNDQNGKHGVFVGKMSLKVVRK